MAESFNLLRRVRSLDIAPEFSGYSGVVIFAGQDDDGNNIEYRAGDQTGTVLEITNEWGSQAQADAIYRKILGYKYQPYKAAGTRIDPSVEIGDAVTVSDIYSGVFSKSTTYGKHISTDLAAPSKEEVEHEFQIQSPTNRQYERFTRSVRANLSITASKIAAEVEDRKLAVSELRASLNIQAGQISAEVSAREKDVSELRASVKLNTENISAEISARTKDVSDLRASLNIQAGQIAAKVSKSGGSSASFAWDMQPEYMSFVSNGSEVLRLDKTGAYVNGEIRASEGEIANFRIARDCLSYNNQTWGGTNSTGIYVGMSGIQCGANSYWRNDGYFKAVHGEFGSLSVDSGESTYSGSLSGCRGSVRGISGSVRDITGSLSTEINVGNTSIGTYVGDIVAGKITADYINAKTATLRTININGYRFAPRTIHYMNSNGTVTSAKVLLTQD